MNRFLQLSGRERLSDGLGYFSMHSSLGGFVIKYLIIFMAFLLFDLPLMAGEERVWKGAQGEHYYELFVLRKMVSGCDLAKLDALKDREGFQHEVCVAVGYNAEFSHLGYFGTGSRSCKGSAKYICSPFLKGHALHVQYYPQKEMAFRHNEEARKFFVNPATVEAEAYNVIFNAVSTELKKVSMEIKQKQVEIFSKKLELSKVNLQIDAMKERLGDEYE